MAGAQGTAVGDGIAIAAQRLKQRDPKSGVMILLTDGESNVGIDPLRAANAALGIGISHLYDWHWSTTEVHIYTPPSGSGRDHASGDRRAYRWSIF